MIERELTLYAVISNKKFFSKGPDIFYSLMNELIPDNKDKPTLINISNITQLDITDPSKNSRSRGRKTINLDEPGKPEYTFTVKTEVKSDDGMDEHKEITNLITEDIFNSLFEKATLYTEKTRYTFKSNSSFINFENKKFILPDILYEVDVYKDKNNLIFDYCKIDIELNKVLDYINTTFPNIKEIDLKLKLSHLPFKPINVIDSNNCSDEDKELIDNFYTQINLLNYE